MEKDDSLPKVSKNVDYVMDVEKITCSVNERSRDSLDSLVLKSSSTTPADMDVLGSKQHTDVDWHLDENHNLYNSQGKAETAQISDDSMDKDDMHSCKTVLSMEGIESLLQESSLSSPSPSSSGIHCALSNDTIQVKSCLNEEKSVYHEYYDRKRSRRSPVSRNLEHYSKEYDRSRNLEHYSKKYDRSSPVSRNLEHYSKEYDRSSPVSRNLEHYSKEYDRSSPVSRNLEHYSKEHGRSSERKIVNTRRDTRAYRPDCYDREEEDAIHHKRYDHFNSNNEKAFCWKVQQDIRNDEEQKR
ncbi:uncharacterized protein LOC124926489 [Impatiens glandulifera]|uniref:uncharacterized protein LOC124926489 n=1 Tax=Impatiens glandulifera TaxID=253017 RepID=UPI001FB0A57E|nr:uncharacterized protein LOC124926489 [Impatiens glandulifera]